VWAKFLTYKRIILNKQVSLKLKLKRFDSVVSPTAMFGLAILPLTKVQIDKLDVVQRRMLRSIVGWVRTHNEQWQDTMRRMNGRFELRWRCVWFVSGQVFFFATLNLQFMWHKICQLGQPELYYGILAQIGAKILTPN
jgi:hypothetical protein